MTFTKRFLRSTLTGLTLLASLAGCSLGPPAGVTVISPFDLQQYAGKWYEIARLDHSFERGLTDINATYSKLPDGDIQVINRGFDPDRSKWKQAVGVAEFTGNPTQGSLKVAFFWPFYGGYHVVELDREHYRWSLVMGPDRDYFWILSKDKHLDTELKQTLLEKVRKLGVDTSKLIWTPQTRSDS